MAYRFSRHYTREEARALLPQVRRWLDQLTQLRDGAQAQERKLEDLMSNGREVGGTVVNEWVRGLVALRDVLMEFYGREIQLKDPDRGLIDFPALLYGKEVFLCWEKGEPDIEFWHNLDAGYAGREPLGGTE